MFAINGYSSHLVNVRLLVEREAGVYFGRDTARNDSQNLFAEFDELQYAVQSSARARVDLKCSQAYETVQGGVSLGI